MNPAPLKAPAPYNPRLLPAIRLEVQWVQDPPGIVVWCDVKTVQGYYCHVLYAP